jgi:hypothetical protein
MNAVTILDVAYQRLAEQTGKPVAEFGPVNGADLESVDLAIMGGCEVCGATLAAYNGCPSRSGYWRCASGCIGGDGFETVAQFEAFENATRAGGGA